MNKPFFSVIMPTRNRGELLPLAIRSVLKQTFENFELIVSDNFSSDDTPRVVQSFDDPRIKYYRSDNPLSIGDSYNFALSHASGEFIAFSSDDDAYTSILLERVKQVIDKYDAQVVAFRIAHFFHNGDFEYNRVIAANTLAIPSHTGKVTKFDSSTAIKHLFGLFGLYHSASDDNFLVTYINNAVYHNSVFSRIKSVRNNIFDFTPADMYLAAAVFFVIDEYYCLDLPLYIWSNWDGNVTASPYKIGNKLMEHYEKLLGGHELQFTPLKFALPLNCTVDAFLQATNDFDKTSIVANVDWARYYTNVFEHLLYLKNMKIDVSCEICAFNDVLAAEPAELRQKVESNINNVSFVSKQFLRKFPLVVRLAKKLLMQSRADRMMFVRGDAGGFDNLLGAAKFLYENFSDTPPATQ